MMLRAANVCKGSNADVRFGWKTDISASLGVRPQAL